MLVDLVYLGSIIFMFYVIGAYLVFVTKYMLEITQRDGEE